MEKKEVAKFIKKFSDLAYEPTDDNVEYWQCQKCGSTSQRVTDNGAVCWDCGRKASECGKMVPEIQDWGTIYINKDRYKEDA